MAAGKDRKARRRGVKLASGADSGRPASNTPRTLLWAVALFILTIAFYVPAMRSGFVWDDDAYVTENETLRSLEGLQRIWLEPGATPQYYPLVFTTFWLEMRLWNLQLAGFHVVNVLLHALGAVLLFILLRRLGIRGAWVAAALFAFHPVHVESVAWVTERKNVLSGVFYLSSLLAFVPFLKSPCCMDAASRRRWTLALAAFLLAMLSKTSTVTLPAALLLLIWWNTGRINRRDVLRVVPFFVLAIAMGAVTAVVEWYNLGGTGEGALGDTWRLHPVERVMAAGRTACFYVQKLLWPAGLAFVYPTWTPDMSRTRQFLYPTAVLGAMLALWLAQKRFGRGPLTALLYFVGTLVPVSGFFNIFYFRYSLVADHFQYLPSIGVFALLTSTLARALERIERNKPRLPAALAVLALIILGSLCWHRQLAFKDAETLWRDTLAKNPACWLAHNNLANLLGSHGQLAAAEHHFDQAVKFNPNLAEAHSNLGAMLAQRGENERALHHFSEALRLEPRLVMVHQNVGALLSTMGKFEEAASHFAEVVRAMPENAPARLKLGAALIRTGNIDQALVHFTKAAKLAPDDAHAARALRTAEELKRQRSQQ